jgi:hypothetical protein
MRRLVMDLRAHDRHDKAVIPRVVGQLGVGDQSMRSWVKSLLGSSI